MKPTREEVREFIGSLMFALAVMGGIYLYMTIAISEPITH